MSVSGSGAIDPSAAAHIAYGLNDADREFFYLTNLTGAWGEPVRLTRNATRDRNVHIAALGEGDAVAAWQTDEGDRECFSLDDVDRANFEFEFEQTSRPRRPKRR